MLVVDFLQFVKRGFARLSVFCCCFPAGPDSREDPLLTVIHFVCHGAADAVPVQPEKLFCFYKPKVTHDEQEEVFIYIISHR